MSAAAAKRTTLPTLRLAWTQKRESGPTATALKPFRAAEGFEAVRRAGDDFLTRTGRRAKVFLARMGPPKQHKARADFSSGFFAVGGFEIDDQQSFTTAEEAADAAVGFRRGRWPCSARPTKPTRTGAGFRPAHQGRQACACRDPGRPSRRTGAEFRAAGFDEFIHVRSNVRTTLARLQRLAGVLS